MPGFRKVVAAHLCRAQCAEGAIMHQPRVGRASVHSVQQIHTHKMRLRRVEIVLLSLPLQGVRLHVPAKQATHKMELGHPYPALFAQRVNLQIRVIQDARHAPQTHTV